MVQFTLGVNLAEYDRWRGKKSSFATALRETIPEFFDPDVGSVVRWLPGAEFDESQAEDNMSHAAMDSWYLHHAAFNVFRYARDGDAQARRVFEASLPYLVRVAHRFEYRWPVFFDLRSLDIIRAESVPGAGGETDVAGLYALVMLHAYELLGEPSYLEEAEAALSRLDGLGFELAYQLNMTGFAAEAALRLWKLTGKRIYLELSEVALANIFDNMWLWCCEYGAGAQFRTFFGLFPLRDAPYIAPYEELEAHAKFHDYLALGGDDVRPSLRLLLGEFQKYGLDCCWFFYAALCPTNWWRASHVPEKRNARFRSLWKTCATAGARSERSDKKFTAPACLSCSSRDTISSWRTARRSRIATTPPTTSRLRATARGRCGWVATREERLRFGSSRQARMRRRSRFAFARLPEACGSRCAALCRRKVTPFSRYAAASGWKSNARVRENVAEGATIVGWTQP